MSNTYYERGKVALTAFVGKNGNASIQLDIECGDGVAYVQLSQPEAMELADAIMARYDKRAISATGDEKYRPKRKWHFSVRSDV